MRCFRRGLFVVVLVLSLLAIAQKSRAEDSESESSLVARDAYYHSGLNVISLAKNNLVTYEGIQYIAYLKTNLTVGIVARDLATGSLTAYAPTLPALVDDDEHRTVALAIDQNGYLHLAYGMHNDGLIYYT